MNVVPFGDSQTGALRAGASVQIDKAEADEGAAPELDVVLAIELGPDAGAHVAATLRATTTDGLLTG